MKSRRWQSRPGPSGPWTSRPPTAYCPKATHALPPPQPAPYPPSSKKPPNPADEPPPLNPDREAPRLLGQASATTLWDQWESTSGAAIDFPDAVSATTPPADPLALAATASEQRPTVLLALAALAGLLNIATYVVGSPAPPPAARARRKRRGPSDLDTLYATTRIHGPCQNETAFELPCTDPRIVPSSNPARRCNPRKRHLFHGQRTRSRPPARRRCLRNPQHLLV